MRHRGTLGSGAARAKGAVVVLGFEPAFKVTVAVPETDNLPRDLSLIGHLG